MRTSVGTAAGLAEYAGLIDGDPVEAAIRAEYAAALSRIGSRSHRVAGAERILLVRVRPEVQEVLRRSSIASLNRD